jgi:peptidoglycan/xylan/chitin deacetylase (PgdA/CDA1 family)
MVAALFLVPTVTNGKEDVIYKDRVAVLVYHHIDNTTQGDIVITAKRFKDQLNDLIHRGYHFINLQQFKHFLDGSGIPDNAVLVTFDDGYASFYNYAYPILSKLGIPAVNFVITKDLEDPRNRRVPALNKLQIAQMGHKPDLFEFQCHTDSLHDRYPDGLAMLTALENPLGQPETVDRHRVRIENDTDICRRKLADLQSVPIDTFSYPFGIYDKQSIEWIKQAGIRYAFTTVSGMTLRSTDPMQIPRINAGSPYVLANSVNNLIVRENARSQTMTQ